MVVTHGGLGCHLAQSTTATKAAAHKTGVCWMPHFHDGALILQYLTALYVGGHLVAFSPLDFLRRPTLWAELIEQWGAQLTGGPNFAWGLLAKRAKASGRDFDLSTLETASNAAEPIDPRTLEQMATLGVPPNALDPLFGLAEAIVFVANRGRGVVDGVASCGDLEASPNRVLVVDAQFRSVADGAVGRLFVQGEALAVGYWNRPELTERVFHNSLEGEGGIWLDTGDLGFVQNGQLYVTGREKEVCAYQADVDHVGIVAELNPKVSVPKADAARGEIFAVTGIAVNRIVWVPRKGVPKTTSGKIKRVAITQRAAEGSWRDAIREDVYDDASTVYVAPRTSDEAAMCALWEELILGVGRVGVHDDWFALGGHSLLAMRLAQRTDHAVPTILANPTVAELCAAEITDLMVPSTNSAAMTRAERRMLYLHLQDPSSTAYHMPFRVRLPEGFDVRANLRRVLDSTPALRTRFVDGAAIIDCKVVVGEGTVDFSAPLDLVNGPTCHFAVDGRVLSGVVHHALFDGASSGILCERLLDADAPAPRRTLRDYAAWETEQGDRVADWVKLLGDAEPRFAGTPEAVANETTEVRLDGTMVGRIRTWCQAKGVGVFAFALWATRHLLRAHGDVETCALGVTHDVRPPSLRHTVGMMVNTVLVPMDGLTDATALHRRWVDHVLPMARTPYDALVAKGYGCNVLVAFNVGLVGSGWASGVAEDLDVDGLEATAKFDLSLSWADTHDGGWAVSFEQGRDWGRLAERFEAVVGALLEGTVPPALLKDERSSVLGWGRGPTPPIPYVCLHELFEAQAKESPGAVALVFAETKMTYAELDAKATALAVRLQGLGVGPDVLVGLMLERGFGLIVGMLGILKAGGAYVPLDPAWPEKRVAFAIDDAGLKVVVTEATNIEGVRHFVLPDDGLEGVALGREVQPGNLAYLIYTSGSTGSPKAVEIEHCSVVNVIEWAFGGVAARCVYAATVVTFDPFGLEVWTPLSRGLMCIVVPSLDDLAPAYAQHGHGLVQCTPSAWSIVRETAPAGLYLGGEALPEPIRLNRRNRATTNVFGLTETTIWSTADTELSITSVIGRPINNTVVFVVHRSTGELCPPGVAGELYIGGAGVARGYHGRPELTAAKFVDYRGVRVFKTGDQVKWNRDGNLVFIGRFDHQVKIRGIRVELGEVEDALAACDGVSGAVVVVTKSQTLVAHVTPADLDGAALVAALSERLPAYMVPSVVRPTAAFPLTSNGKLDRKALPAVDASTEYVAPRSPEETAMCALWEELLDVGRVGVHDDWFALGGHSLLAMRLAQRTDHAVPAILANPTVAELYAAEVTDLMVPSTNSAAMTPFYHTQPFVLQQCLWHGSIQQRANHGLKALSEAIPIAPSLERHRPTPSGCVGPTQRQVELRRRLEALDVQKLGDIARPSSYF